MQSSRVPEFERWYEEYVRDDQTRALADWRNEKYLLFQEDLE